GDFSSRQAFGLFVLNLDDPVARPETRLVCWRSGERSNHNRLIVAGANGHSNAIIVALLVFTEELIVARIEEVGVRIKCPQHPRNRALIDGFLGFHLIRVALFHYVVDLSEALKAFLGWVVDRSGGRDSRTTDDSAHDRAQSYE